MTKDNDRSEPAIWVVDSKTTEEVLLDVTLYPISSSDENVIGRSVATGSVKLIVKVRIPVPPPLTPWLLETDAIFTAPESAVVVDAE